MIKKNNIRIHFLGWDKRWDTTIDVLKGIYYYYFLFSTYHLPYDVLTGF